MSQGLTRITRNCKNMQYFDLFMIFPRSMSQGLTRTTQTFKSKINHFAAELSQIQSAWRTPEILRASLSQGSTKLRGDLELCTFLMLFQFIRKSLRQGLTRLQGDFELNKIDLNFFNRRAAELEQRSNKKLHKTCPLGSLLGHSDSREAFALCLKITCAP